MKKIFCLMLCLLMLATLTVPSFAADAAVSFTADSSFAVGGVVKVDEMKTQQAIMDLGKNAAEYNAALEGNMQYYWYRNDTYYADGTALTLTENDKGCTFYCQVYLFNDADRTQQCGVYDSEKFTVPAGSTPTIPTITTKTLPNGTVGEAYYQKLECSDPDVAYTLFRTSLPDGLTLTQHGEIEGIPTKEGFWHVVVMATPEAGADYATTCEFDISIAKKAETETPPATSTSPTTEEKAPETQPSKNTESATTTTQAENTQGMPWWGVLLIALAAAGIAVSATLLIQKKRK